MIVAIGLTGTLDFKKLTYCNSHHRTTCSASEYLTDKFCKLPSISPGTRDDGFRGNANAAFQAVL